MNIVFFVLFSIVVNPSVIAGYIYIWIFGDQKANPGDPNDPNNFYLLRIIQPLVILIVNSGIIPSLCDIIGRIEGHHTKSQRQAAIMKKNFYFLFMNTIIVPLSVNTTLAIFFSELEWDKLDYQYFVFKIMANFAGLIFIVVCINWTFLSNGVSMLDIVHHIFKFFAYLSHKKAMAKEEHPMPFVDDYPFDLGYF